MLLGVFGVDFGSRRAGLGSRLLLLCEFRLSFLDLTNSLFSLGVPLLRGLASLSSDLLTVQTLNVSDDSSCSAFLSLGSLVSLELLVEPSPDNSPSDDLTFNLAVMEATSLLGGEDDKSSVLGDDPHSFSGVYLLF